MAQLRLLWDILLWLKKVADVNPIETLNWDQWVILDDQEGFPNIAIIAGYYYVAPQLLNGL